MKKKLLLIISTLLLSASVKAATADLSISPQELKEGDKFTINVYVKDSAAWNIHVSVNGPVNDNCKINQADASADALDTDKKFSETCTVTGTRDITIVMSGDVTSAEDGIPVNISETKTILVKEPEEKEKAYLSDLYFKDSDIKIDFDKDKTDYQFIIDSDKIVIDATAGKEDWSIEGLGEKLLEYGENEFKIIVKSKDDEKTYTLKITRNKPVVTIKDKSERFSLSLNTLEETYKNYTLQITEQTNLVSKDLKSTIEKETKKSLINLYDIIVIDENNKEVEMANDTYTIKIQIDETLKKYKDYRVVYIDEENKIETFDTTTDDDYIIFETTHLSKYGILGNLIETEKAKENSQTIDNILVYVVMIIGFGVIAILAKRKLHKTN